MESWTKEYYLDRLSKYEWQERKIVYIGSVESILSFNAPPKTKLKYLKNISEAFNELN